MIELTSEQEASFQLVKAMRQAKKSGLSLAEAISKLPATAYSAAQLEPVWDLIQVRKAK